MRWWDLPWTQTMAESLLAVERMGGWTPGSFAGRQGGQGLHHQSTWHPKASPLATSKCNIIVPLSLSLSLSTDSLC